MEVTLKKKYYDGFQVHGILNEELNDGKLIMQILKRFADAPSADVVEVVRCKDCKWYECSIMVTHFGVCCHPDWVDDNCGFEVSENGWCYRGERV